MCSITITYFSDVKHLRRGNSVDNLLPEVNTANDPATTIEKELYEDTIVEKKDLYVDAITVEEENCDDVETKKGIIVFSSVLDSTIKKL